MKRTLRLVAAACALGWAAPPTAGAQQTPPASGAPTAAPAAEPPAPAPPAAPAAEPPVAAEGMPADGGPRSLALVVSGGVSLGAYEAGWVHYASEAGKQMPGRVDLKLVAGASAGSVNSLVVAMNHCLPKTPDPQDSVAWSAWIPIGYESLFVEEEVSGINMFSRAPLLEAGERLWKVWRGGLRQGCDILLAVSTTRFDPINIALAEDLTVPRQEEKFVLRIRGRGPGRAPMLSNYIDPDVPVPQPKLRIVPDAEGTGRAARENFENLRDLLFASAAFPLAFWPQVLSFCLTDPNAVGTDYCQKAQYRRFFIDGGVFDNNPLRLSLDLARRGLRRDATGRSHWRDLREPEQLGGVPDDDMLFFYLDPDTAAFPVGQSEVITSEQPAVLPLAGRLLSGFANTARAKELYRLAEREKKLSSRMRLTRNHYPTMSGLLGAFMGFFERDFREFDFYLGMYDAYLEAGGDVVDHMRSVVASDEAPGMRPLQCMIGWFDSSAEALRARCSGLDRNFLVMLQVAIDRVHSACHDVDAETLPDYTTHHCRRAAEGHDRPVVTGVADIGGEVLRRQGEDDFAHAMRLLAVYQFHFRDLGLEPHEARYGRIRVRRKLLKMIRYLARAQPTFADRTIVETALRTGVNGIAYEPPRDFAYFLAGSAFEVGASFLPFDWNRSFLRFHGALQLVDLGSLLTPSEDLFRFTLAGGLELHPPSFSTPALQSFVGVRAGYQFGTVPDRLGTRDCTEERAFGDQRNCSQFVLQNYWVLTAIDRLRFQVTFEFFPFPESYDDKGIYDIQFGIGYQVF